MATSTVSSKRCEGRSASWHCLIRKRRGFGKPSKNKQIIVLSFEITYQMMRACKITPTIFESGNRLGIEREKEITITYRVQNLELDQVMAWFTEGIQPFIALLADEAPQELRVGFLKKKKLVVPLLFTETVWPGCLQSGRHFCDHISSFHSWNTIWERRNYF